MVEIQITGRKAKKFGKTGFTGGFNVIEFPPKFGGQKVHGKFRTKSSAEKFAKKLAIKMDNKLVCERVSKNRLNCLGERGMICELEPVKGAGPGFWSGNCRKK